MKYHNRIITFLTILVIIYSFFYYNKGGGASGGYIEDQTSGEAKFNLIIDPERSDLTWYEKLIIKRAKKQRELEEQQEK